MYIYIVMLTTSSIFPAGIEHLEECKKYFEGIIMAVPLVFIGSLARLLFNLDDRLGITVS
jgi:hypothetical protein